MTSKSSNVVDNRLDRIEQKIDKLSEAIISIARAEEKLVMLENDKKFLMQKMVEIDDRVAVVEKKVDETQGTISIIQRITWIGISTAVAAAIGTYLKR